MNLKGVVKAPLLTPLSLSSSVAATFLMILALPPFVLSATVWVFHQGLGRFQNLIVILNYINIIVGNR